MLNDLSKEIHKNAIDHGFWDHPRPSTPETIALCHSELSEALEEYRDRKPMAYTVCDLCPHRPKAGWNCAMLDRCEHKDTRDKPEGVAVEMIDCMIRILDWCGYHEIDVDTLIKAKMEFNITRPYRHGGKHI